ncbi:universal stress protein [Sphingobacterium thalpophilum]|uniref:Universal stress protein n=1 Tax=Sphingobacterium thalpophilum TaxID=259 RepID=A0A4U9UP03_9SPHI|nr:universal stress protein [Sphingobacterium thalpophilum]VTR35316.1 universal stress protein UspE [Sphingobacterium thalpophilum]
MEAIIITTDFSEAAMNAARYAAGLSKSIGIKRIVLYHSYDNAPAATDVPVAETDTPLAHEGSLLALEIVEREIGLVIGSDSGIAIDLVANGMPLELGVEQLAEQWRTGLVVVGTTGKSGLEKFFVGSNTVSLATSCPVPLLIVPKEAKFEAIEKIVFACDLKKVTRSKPVSEIGWWLDRFQAKLLVLNVALEGKRFDPDMIPEQYKMHELLDGFNPSYHYEEGEDIAEEIADFAEDEEAGLVITVPKSYGFFEGLFHRSVSRKLLDKSEVPLLLLKEKQ